MTEKKKPGRKPRKVEEAATKTLSETLSESEVRRQAREDVLAQRALDAEARRNAREDAVAERRLAHDLRRMEATEAMFSRFAHSVVGIARDGVQAMMPVYEHIGSEATRDIILAQVESQKHAMALLTTVLVDGVPAAIRAYAEVRAASTPSPVTHEEFKVWTDTLMGHVYARNDAHLDLLDATIRTSSTSSLASTLAGLPSIKLSSGEDCDGCEVCDPSEDDEPASSRGYGGLDDYEFTPSAVPVPPKENWKGWRTASEFISTVTNRPPSASRMGKDVIISTGEHTIGFDSDFSDQIEAAENALVGTATVQIYGDNEVLAEFIVSDGDDILHAIANAIRGLLPDGGAAKFRVVVFNEDEVNLDTVCAVACETK